ncbi:MAG: nucleoside hydrolase [Pseudomonadota bacterium]
MHVDPKAIDVKFLKSPEQAALLAFHDVGGDSLYVPRDGQDPIGPVVSAESFITENFGSGQRDTFFLCDPGTDDWMAGVLALSDRDNFRIDTIVPSFGNVPLRVTFNNARKLVALTGEFDVHVASGADRPLVGSMPEDASAEHGEDGLGGASHKLADSLIFQNMSQVQSSQGDGQERLKQTLIDRAESSGAPITILNTGSMTDLCVVLEQLAEENPKALSKIQGISLMGGGIDTGRWHTNITDHAEFNFFQDPIAAKRAFELIEEHNIPTLVVPLEVTHTTGVRENHEGAWLKQQAVEKHNPVAAFTAEMYSAGGFDVERSHDFFKFPADKTTRFMHDPNVVTAIQKPKLYSGVYASIDIVTEGEEAGRMLLKPKIDGPIFVALKADAPQVLMDWQSRIANYRGAPANRL